MGLLIFFRSIFLVIPFPLAPNKCRVYEGIFIRIWFTIQYVSKIFWLYLLPSTTIDSIYNFLYTFENINQRQILLLFVKTFAGKSLNLLSKMSFNMLILTTTIRTNLRPRTKIGLVPAGVFVFSPNFVCMCVCSFVGLKTFSFCRSCLVPTNLKLNFFYNLSTIAALYASPLRSLCIVHQHFLIKFVNQQFL